MLSHLQVKVWNLAQEAHYIRSKEKKWKDRARAARAKAKDPKFSEDNFWSMRNHRMELRVESRCSQLAYGFLRGRKYHQMEDVAYSAPDWSRIENIAKRFSQDDPRLVIQSFAEWKDEAAVFQKDQLQIRLHEKEMQAKQRAAAKEEIAAAAK